MEGTVFHLKPARHLDLAVHASRFYVEHSVFGKVCHEKLNYLCASPYIV